MTEKAQKNPLGVTGERLRINLKLLRESRGFSYRELSEKLDAVGRPIPTLGLSRIEKGERRVDADDLVALALVLGVNASALLLPPTAQGAGELTGIDHPVSSFRLWSWAAGELPLLPEDDPACREVMGARTEDGARIVDPSFWDQRSQRWYRETRPHHRIDRVSDWTKHRGALNNAANAAQEAVDAGMSIPGVIDWLMESLRQSVLFGRVDGTAFQRVTVGDSAYNRLSLLDDWREISEEEARAMGTSRKTEE